MTVRENLELGAYLRRDANVSGDLDRVLDLFPRLQEREKQKAGTMSGGEQQMLAMGRALMADPTLLLLDEPSMGLAPILVDRIYETVREINKQGTTILLVEQNANYALEVSSARLRARDGQGRAGRQVRGAPGEPGGPERLPGDLTMTVFALLGATALWLLYAWLLSAIVASYLSGRKGYGERVGLACGLLLNVIGVIIWLVVPPKQESLWKKVGPFGRGGPKQTPRADAATAAPTRRRLATPATSAYG